MQRYDDERHLRPTGIFLWNPLASEDGIDAYLRQCRATEDDIIIEEAEYLANVAREALAYELKKPAKA